MMFLFVVATISIVGVSVLVSKTSFQVERQVISQAIANDRIETIQAMSYGIIGLVPAGATKQSNATIEGQGGIEYVETITQNQHPYTVTTDIIPVDDPANGTVSGSLAMDTADYKSISVQVSPGIVSSGNVNAGVVSAATIVANWPPQACIPGDPTACQIGPFPTPPPTFSWNFKGEPVGFIEKLSQYPRIITDNNGYGLYNDSASRLQACSLKGYRSEALDSPGSWSSCTNDHNVKWNSSTNVFDVTSGCLPANSQSSQFTCSNPKPVANCTYKVACPASGQCSDAYLARGYTPRGVQYSNTCKSVADCATGFTCNISSGICEAASVPQKYEYATTGDPKASGQTADCTTKFPNPAVFGSGWVLRNRQVLISNNRDICLWRRATTNNYEYKLVQSGATSCPASYVSDSSFVLKSSGCVRSATSTCPDEYTTGKSLKADYCLYQKTNGLVAGDLTISMHTIASPTSSNQANCTTNAIPDGAFSGPDRACVSGGTYCGSDVCLWQNVCPLPSNICTVIEYDASKSTLPDAQGWTAHVDGGAVSTNYGATPKYITLTDTSSTDYVDYTFPGIDPAVFMDQDWTYEITMRTQNATKEPLQVGPIGMIVSDGLKYASSVFENSLVGSLGVLPFPHSYITSKSQTTTGSFRTYKITNHKRNAGVSDDAYDVAVDGITLLSSIRRSDGYVPGTGDFSKGLLFGLWSKAGQGSVDVSRVLFKTGNCY